MKYMKKKSECSRGDGFGKSQSNTAYVLMSRQIKNQDWQIAEHFEPRKMKTKKSRNSSLSAGENPMSKVVSPALSNECHVSLLNQTAHYTMSRHCRQRADQRGINPDAIALTLEYGRVFVRQGLIFHVLGHKEIPVWLRREREHLLHTVVVQAADAEVLITTYRGNNPIRRIKRKSKVLFKSKADKDENRNVQVSFSPQFRLQNQKRV